MPEDQPFIPNAPLMTTINTRRMRDCLCVLLLLDNIPEQQIPVWVKLDGNCLFQSGFVLMTGDEDLSNELHLLTAAELFLDVDLTHHWSAKLRASKRNSSFSSPFHFLKSFESWNYLQQSFRTCLVQNSATKFTDCPRKKPNEFNTSKFILV